MAVTMKRIVFWVAMLCSSEKAQHFGGTQPPNYAALQPRKPYSSLQNLYDYVATMFHQTQYLTLSLGRGGGGCTQDETTVSISGRRYERRISKTDALYCVMSLNFNTFPVRFPANS
jgi:hypothetical protein